MIISWQHFKCITIFVQICTSLVCLLTHMGNICSTGNIYVPQEVFLAEIFASTLSTRGDHGAGVNSRWWSWSRRELKRWSRSRSELKRWSRSRSELKRWSRSRSELKMVIMEPEWTQEVIKEQEWTVNSRRRQRFLPDPEQDPESEFWIKTGPGVGVEFSVFQGWIVAFTKIKFPLTS